MKKEEIIVPRGIRYVSDWTDFSLIEYPHILDKQIPGCGFTQYCITNSQNIILCSPRRILLDNKSEQNPDVFYFKNTSEEVLGVDKDLMSKIKRVSRDIPRTPAPGELTPECLIMKLREDLLAYVVNRRSARLPCKILVTYDSFRHVKEVISGLNIFNEFYTVIDEFQSIFTDSRFKSDTELGFLGHLQDVRRLCFVSATPMMDKYLDMLDEFRELPYFELNWIKDDPYRLVKPELKVRQCKSVSGSAAMIIDSYKSGKFVNAMNSFSKVVESREAVLYVNSVKNIVSIIKKTKLQPEEINILCADTPQNERKIKSSLGKKYSIGKVPTRGEVHKMFTFCTRTVYLGADFYSTNARSFILSDANVDALAVDISLDLPQILGRQRLDENPWNNRADLFYKPLTQNNRVTQTDFDGIIAKKKEVTEKLLRVHDCAPGDTKYEHSNVYRKLAKAYNYKDDYVAVNTHGGDNLYPVFNNLVLIAEMRAFEVMQVDYVDRFTVFSKITAELENDDTSVVRDFLIKFANSKSFDRYKMLVEFDTNTYPGALDYIFTQIPIDFGTYYKAIGPNRIKSCGYNVTDVRKEYEIQMFDISTIVDEVYRNFSVGDNITMSEIKDKLQEIYDRVGYNKMALSIDILNYFEVKKGKVVTDLVTKKRDNSFKLLSKKL